VAERLAEAERLGLRTAIVTRNRDDRVAARCVAVGLEHQWDAVVCANDEPTRDKAELYRRALDLLGVSADDAVAFEDSPAGLDAATRAGVACIAVPNAITRGTAFAGAAVVLPSLAEVSLEEILARLAATL
jgi:putative hydrolase of the HAD superfamily